MLNMSPLGGGGGGHFWLKGHTLNKLCRGPPGNATYQISRLYDLSFQTIRIFHVFPISAYVKHVHPGQAIFGPRGLI